MGTLGIEGDYDAVPACSDLPHLAGGQIARVDDESDAGIAAEDLG